MAESFWTKTADRASLAPPPGDVDVDVVVVGAGITGVTTAYLLAQAGRSVALVERGRVAEGDTAGTTAHLTAITDASLQDLVKRFGDAAAREAWRMGQAAIEEIERIARVERIDCELARVPALIWTDRGQHVDWVHAEAEEARRLGFPARVLDVRERPFGALAAFELDRQGKFHPLLYVRQLAARFQGLGGVVLEDAFVEAVEGGGPFELRLRGSDRKVRAGAVVEATHQPLGEHVLLQTKLLPYQSYAIAVELPPGAVPEALYYDTDDPYNYLRIERRDGHDVGIFGGADLRTGERRDTTRQFAVLEKNLERWLRHVPRRTIARWSAEFLDPADGLPYVGEVASGRFVATGFSGTGMTFGTVAAMVIRDQVMGTSNAWGELLSPRRKPHRSLLQYLKQNLEFPWAFVVDRLRANRDLDAVTKLAPGQGTIVNDEGHRIAVFRDEAGRLHGCSATCTHMGCLVSWNSAQKTWDCRCHGSRFEPTGEVRAGPATTPLDRVDLEERLDDRREAA